MMRRPQRTDRIIIILPLRRIELVLDDRGVFADVLQAPDAAGHVAFVVAAVPVGDEQAAIDVEMDVARAEVRVGAGDQRLLLRDVVAVVEDVAEDAAIGAGETVSAPVAAEEIALELGRIRGSIVAQELRVSAAVDLLAGRGERIAAREPFVVNGGPTVAMIIDALDDADEAIGVALAIGEDPELAEGIVLEGVGDA